MARGFSKTVTGQQKQTDSLPSMNILKASFLEHFAKLNDPRIERSKEHLLKDIIAIAMGASHICKNTSSDSFLLPSSFFLFSPGS